MTVYIALLRGINIGAHKRISMAALRDLCCELGLDDARSLLQSGNLVFRAPARQAAVLESRLQQAAAARLGVDTEFFLRTAEQWAEIVARNPFRSEAGRDPGHLLLMLLKRAPTPGAVRSLQDAISGPEIVRARGTEAYFVYPNGIGRSRLTNALIERKLGTSGTGRNWNTVLKLAALATAGDDAESARGPDRPVERAARRKKRE